jgi:ABC-type phosphate/phosphonate transport system substrate-binding protein
MYNAGPEASAAWRALFERVFADTGLDIEVIEHKWPQPIEALWSEPALCSAFMCGWPFAQAEGMQPIASPVPSPARYAGEARYCSEFLAREESGWTRVEDAFGHRFGWMARNSHSGFNAPRAYLASFVDAHGPRLFSESIGPLGNPASSLEALKDRRVDLIALDGFYLDLARRYQPQKLSGVRTVGNTDWAPMPPLVASPSIDAATVERLRSHLLRLHEDADYKPLLNATLLERFVRVDRGAYSALIDLERRAIASGYADIR